MEIGLKIHENTLINNIKNLMTKLIIIVYFL